MWNLYALWIRLDARRPQVAAGAAIDNATLLLSSYDPRTMGRAYIANQNFSVWSSRITWRTNSSTPAGEWAICVEGWSGTNYVLRHLYISGVNAGQIIATGSYGTTKPRITEDFAMELYGYGLGHWIAQSVFDPVPFVWIEHSSFSCRIANATDDDQPVQWSGIQYPTTSFDAFRRLFTRR